MILHPTLPVGAPAAGVEPCGVSPMSETKPLKISSRWRRDPLHKGDYALLATGSKSKALIAWVAHRETPKGETWLWATLWGSSGWRPVKEQAMIMAERAARREFANWRRRMWVN